VQSQKELSAGFCFRSYYSF